MSFDKIFDLTAGVNFNFYNIIGVERARANVEDVQYKIMGKKNRKKPNETKNGVFEVRIRIEKQKKINEKKGVGGRKNDESNNTPGGSVCVCGGGGDEEKSGKKKRKICRNSYQNPISFKIERDNRETRKMKTKGTKRDEKLQNKTQRKGGKPGSPQPGRLSPRGEL